MTTAEELIIEMMPFSKELKEYCKKYPNFAKALKIIYFDKFIALQVIEISYSPNYPKDEVIGIHVYDYGKKIPKFKQDFIVNVGKKDDNFILYTGLRDVVDGKQVKHVSEFLATYGKEGYYKNAHHPNFDEFSEELKDRALKAIALADKRKKGGYTKIDQEHVQKIYKSYKEHKKIN